MNSKLKLFLFFILVALVASFGAYFKPGDWYLKLVKPTLIPPNWVFGPVWTVIYITIAISGWLIFSSQNLSLKLTWILQLILNGIWSWIFFGLYRIDLALLDILALVTCVLIMTIISFKNLKPVFWLSIPYLIWVSYATFLNASIWFYNR